MWRKDHRIPPFAKTKTAKDGAPFCVVAQARGGPPATASLTMLRQGVLSMLFCIPTPGRRTLGHSVRQGRPLMPDPSPQGEIIEPTASAVGWHGDFTSPAFAGRHYDVDLNIV